MWHMSEQENRTERKYGTAKLVHGNNKQATLPHQMMRAHIKFDMYMYDMSNGGAVGSSMRAMRIS